MFNRISFLVISLFFSLTSFSAQEWQLIGECRANLQGDRDVIQITPQEKFVAIKLEVEDAHLEMYDIKVFFANGETFSPNTRLQFSKGEQSRTIDLPGNNRTITKVVFLYQTKKNKKQTHARIQLFGKTAENTRKEHWEKLGERRVAFNVDKDVLDIPASENRFDALRLKVEDGNLDMYDVRIHFRNGEIYSPELRFNFKEGSHSGLIDLPGNKRSLEKVVFFYKSELKKGHATVQVFGRHTEDSGPTKPTESIEFSGWERLGSRIVDFKGDRDVISGSDKGKFSVLKLAVDDGDLEMFDIQIVFKNGETFSPQTRLVFDENTRSRDFDLPGKKRNIEKIIFYYKSIRATKDGKSTIYVFGKN